MATSIIAPLWMYAKITNTYLEDSSTWDATNDHSLIVPAHERWILIGGIVNRDQSSTVSISIKDASGQTIMSLCVLGASTGTTPYPYNADTMMHAAYHPIVMDEGECINFSFGAAQGANGIITLKYLVVPM